jgi:putative nucleotidyltransferase with HDIG domain
LAVNTPVGYRVLVVDPDEHGLAEGLAKVRRDLLIEAVRTTADAQRKLGEAAYAAIIAVHRTPELDGIELLGRVAATGTETLRLLVSPEEQPDLAEEDLESCFHLVGAAASPRNLARFVTEGLKLQRISREHKELVKKLGGEFERLRKREKLLDMVVRERTKELESAYLKLKAANRQALLGLAEAIEAKDPYTKGHCGRVAAYAMALARECHYPEHDMESLEFAAFLHDIGKIGVRDAVLLKPGPLDEEEWKHMKIHPEVGFEIASKIDMLKPTMAAIRNHHERWDGTGYPDRIAGEDIPLSARVVCVADCFDAMATDRPYKRALSLDESLANLRKSRGVQFDPQLVDLFVERRIGELFMY